MGVLQGQLLLYMLFQHLLLVMQLHAACAKLQAVP